MTLRLKLDRSEIIWSIPIIAVLIYLIYYGFRAKDITNLCFNYCTKLGASGYKIDGSLKDAFFLDEERIYCGCYYSFLNSSVVRSIKDIRQLGKIGGDLSDKGVVFPFS